MRFLQRLVRMFDLWYHTRRVIPNYAIFAIVAKPVVFKMYSSTVLDLFTDGFLKFGSTYRDIILNILQHSKG